MIYINYKLNIILYVILAIIGASFVFIPTESLINFVFSVIGIMIVLFNIVPAITYIDAAIKNKQYIVPAITYSLMVMFGLLFIFGWSYLIVSILFGISLVISPIIRIIQGKFKKEVLKKELPYIVIGILVFFIPFTKVIGIIIKVFGGLVILYSIFMIVMIFVNKNKDNNNSKGNTNNSDNIIIDAEIRDL